jgi:hypothetical protein
MLPYKVKLNIYDANANVKLSSKQKELYIDLDGDYQEGNEKAIDNYEIIKQLLRNIFLINSKYKFAEETQSINTVDDTKKLKYYIFYDYDKKSMDIIFIQIMTSEYLTIHELQHITQIIYYNLQTFFCCKLKEPIIYLPKP